MKRGISFWIINTAELDFSQNDGKKMVRENLKRSEKRDDIELRFATLCSAHEADASDSYTRVYARR